MAPAVAAGLGFWSGLSYPSGHFFFLYPFLDFLRGQDFRKPRGWVVLALWGAVFAGSTLLVCLIFQYKFGMFWLYFIHHAQNNDTRGNFFSLVNYLLRYGHENERLSFLWYAFGFILVSLRLPKPWREPSYWFVIVALAFTPATGRWVCLYRYDLMAICRSLRCSGPRNARPGSSSPIWEWVSTFSSGTFTRSTSAETSCSPEPFSN